MNISSRMYLLLILAYSALIYTITGCSADVGGIYSPDNSSDTRETSISTQLTSARAPCNGVWSMNASGYAFTLVISEVHGNGEIIGAMIPQNNPTADMTHRVEGFCDGYQMSFTRYMDEYGTYQSYAGSVDPNGADWTGDFTQPNVAGTYAWRAYAKRNTNNISDCNGAWNQYANGYAFDLVMREADIYGNVVGAMIPWSGGATHRITGKCNGSKVNFVRYMSDTNQSYNGSHIINSTPSDWHGTFTQPSVGGSFAWQAYTY